MKNGFWAKTEATIQKSNLENVLYNVLSLSIYLQLLILQASQQSMHWFSKKCTSVQFPTDLRPLINYPTINHTPRETLLDKFHPQQIAVSQPWFDGRMSILDPPEHQQHRNSDRCWCSGLCSTAHGAPDFAIAPTPCLQWCWSSITCVGLVVWAVGRRWRRISVPWLFRFGRPVSTYEVR